jgi:transcription initiation factor TFIIIB Brf1 subunit/transcription initiation factor TFIIB
LRLVITVFAFASRTLLSLLAFSFKLRTRLFFSKRAHVSRMKRILKKNRLPDELREELLKLYSKELDRITSALGSIARVTELVKLLDTQKVLKERWTAERSRT